MTATAPSLLRVWISLGGGAGAAFLGIGILLTLGAFPGAAAARATGPFLAWGLPGTAMELPAPAPPATPGPDAPTGAPAASALPTPAPAGADRPALAPPTADHQVVAPPSVSAALIDQVLAEWNSPAAGQGALFYDLGVRYGIDPAYALGFYIHESGCGTLGVARFTMSIGNIRTTPGYRDYQGYRAYDSWEASIADWYKLIKELYVESWGKRTVAQIVPTYAPYGDNNDPPSYIANVQNLVDSWQQR